MNTSESAPSLDVVELSRPVLPSAIKREGFTLSLRATPAECQALAQRFGLLCLDRLGAEVRIASVGAGSPPQGYQLHAEIEADYQQTCVVTLEPLARTFRGTVSRRYVVSREASAPTEHEVWVSALESDPPDLLTCDTLDVGEVVAEAFGLELDPFPRAPDVEFWLPEQQSWGRLPDQSPGEDTVKHPFAALARLKLDGDVGGDSGES